MKFAAIADIHGNRLALDAVLADIDGQGIADILNLGDHFSGPLEAGRTADLLMERNFPSIRGNHDRWLIQRQPARMGPSDRAAHDQLDARHLDWLRALPPTLVWRDEVFCCHATPTSDLRYWLERITDDGRTEHAPQEAIEAEAADTPYPLILCAHTHIPRAVRLTDGRMIVNPGSVGCPAYDDDHPIYHRVETRRPEASYAILEKSGNEWTATFRLVPYEHMAMSDLAKQNGRPEWASALATGRIG